MGIQKLRRHKAEDRVAQKFQALIALGLAVLLIGIGAVSQRGFQQVPVPEMISDFFFQLIHQSSAFSFMYSMLSSMSCATLALT